MWGRSARPKALTWPPTVGILQERFKTLLEGAGMPVVPPTVGILKERFMTLLEGMQAIAAADDDDPGMKMILDVPCADDDDDPGMKKILEWVHLDAIILDGGNMSAESGVVSYLACDDGVDIRSMQQKLEDACETKREINEIARAGRRRSRSRHR